MKQFDFQFQVPFLGGQVDKANGVIRGVSLITGNLTAEGHDLEVTPETLREVLSCAVKEGKVPVKLNHGSGVENICGYLENFSLSGDKVRGDWHLLKSHREYATTMEKAEVMPGCLGLSVAFKGKGVATQGGKKRAKCERLIAADCVTQPAANPDGLFSAKVDTDSNGIMPDPILPVTEPTLSDVLGAINQQNEAIASLTQKVEAQDQLIQESIGSQEPPTLAELDQMDDSALAQLGLTRADVNAAISEMNTAEAAEAASAVEAGGLGANANPGAVATAAEFRALQNQVILLQKKITTEEANAETQEVETAFSVIDAKIVELGEKNDELVEFNTTLKADNEALRFAVKTGCKPVGAGFEEVTLFTVKEGKDGSFEKIVTTKFDELMKQSGMTEIKAKSLAIDFGVKRNKAAYQEYRARGGVIEFGSK
jgi:uncharacterized protein YjiS (DUF1127 family)